MTKGASQLFKLLKNIPNVIGIISSLIYIAYLSLNVINGKGVPILNYILLGASVIFLFAYVVMMARGGKSEMKSAKRYYKWIKMSIKGLSLFIAIYGFTASEGSRLMPALLVALWILQVNGEIKKERKRRRREKAKEKLGASSPKRKRKHEPAPDEEIAAPSRARGEVDFAEGLTVHSVDNVTLSDDENAYKTDSISLSDDF